MTDVTVEDVRGALEDAGLGDLTVERYGDMIVVLDRDGGWWDEEEVAAEVLESVKGEFEEYDESLEIVVNHPDDVDAWDVTEEQRVYGLGVVRISLSAEGLNEAFGEALDTEE